MDLVKNRNWLLCLGVCASILGVSAATTAAQVRARRQPLRVPKVVRTVKTSWVRPKLVAQPAKAAMVPVATVLVTKTAIVRPRIVANPVPAMSDVAVPLIFPERETQTLFNKLLSEAIDDRVGAPYVYGTEGPRVYDCSGFVWSVFQEAGISFERGSARTLWSRFQPVGEMEKYQFGTLVFFNGFSHMGIVADEHGFYHASSSHGVVYSPFNDYWMARVDGFRRIPMGFAKLTD